MITRKLGRKKAHRVSMLANLATSLILYESVKTTQAKGKEAAKIVQKMIDLGKKKDLASIRALAGYFNDKNAVKKIREDLVVRYKTRVGGYVRIFKMGTRAGDGSKMVIIRLIGRKEEEKQAQAKPTLTDKKSTK